MCSDHCRFVGGELNTCYNAVDRHVSEGNGGQIAIIYDSPITEQIRKITYRELWQQVRYITWPSASNNT